MWKCTLLITVVAVSAIAPIAALAGTGVPDDQLWTELDVIAPVAADTTIKGMAQYRVSESLENPVFSALGADLDYHHENWTFTGGYRHQVTGHSSDEPEITQLATVMATWAPYIGESTVLLRLRVDNTFTAHENPWRLRLRAEYRLRSRGLGPIRYLFANDEVFYKFSDNDWYRNRFQAGVNLELTERASMRVYYQYQYSNNTTPASINALGLTLSIAL